MSRHIASPGNQQPMYWIRTFCHGPLARYAIFWVAHAPGMPGTFFPPLRVSDPDMHHGTCVTHVPWCMPGSLTSAFWSRWRGKRSWYSRRMRNPQFYVSGKRPIGCGVRIPRGINRQCAGCHCTSPRYTIAVPWRINPTTNHYLPTPLTRLDACFPVDFEKFALTFVPMGSIEGGRVLGRTTALCLFWTKPLSQTMMAKFPGEYAGSSHSESVRLTTHYSDIGGLLSSWP